MNASYSQLPLETRFITELRKKPKDKNVLLRVLTFLFGIVQLMPFNFMVTANNYWMHRLKDDSLNSTDLTKKNVWQQYFSTGITIAEGAGLLITGIFMLIAGRKFNLTNRLYIALTVFIVCLTLNLILVNIRFRGWQNVSFCTALFLAFLMNSTCSVFYISSMAFVSKFPKKYLPYYLHGAGYSGVIISTISLITVAIGNDPEQSADIYFSFGITLLLLTILLLWRSRYTSMYSQYMDNQQENTKCKEASMSEIVRIAKNIWPCMVTHVVVLIPIMSLHPGLTALVVSENYGKGNLWNDKYFVPVITFLFTDVCGVIGRLFGTPFIKKSNILWLIIVMILRVALFDFLVLHCNISPRKNLPVYFYHDWEYIIIVGSLSFSNGVFHNACILSLERMELENKEMAFTLFSSVGNMLSIFYYPMGPILVSMV